MRGGAGPAALAPHRETNRLANFRNSARYSMTLILQNPSYSNASLTSSELYPSVRLSNSQLALTVYLPNPRHGFYRGPRFDWSGMLGHVQFSGHTFFTPWRPSLHDPEGNDDVLGPAEEFDQDDPPGFGLTPPGGTFLKIGVGLLTRPDDAPYRFLRPYTVAQAGVWDIAHGVSWIEFTQNIAGNYGHAYQYVKRVSLPADQPALSIEHRLENTGTQDLNTHWYCHNFVNIDCKATGPDYGLSLAFKPSFRPKHGEEVKVNRNTISFTRLLTAPQFGLLSGPGLSGANTMIQVQNRSVRAGVRLRLSEPMTEMRLFAAPGAVCPEPFLRLHIPPGTSRTWQTDYEFFGF